MGRIALTVLKQDPDSRLSPHFGKAKWVLVHDPETGTATVHRNEGLDGRAAVDLMSAAGCTDAVLSGIGGGALGHLRRAGIRGWYGPPELGAAELLVRLADGALAPAEAPSHASEHRHHH